MSHPQGALNKKIKDIAIGQNMKPQKAYAQGEGQEDVVKAKLNELIAAHNAVLAKLDADAGVTDTNFVALHTVAAL